MTGDNKLTLTFSILLKRLLQNEKIPLSKFSSGINKTLLGLFTIEKVLLISQQRTKYVYSPNNENLKIYLQSWGISNLDNFINFLEKEETTRAEAAEATSNSKHKKGRIFNGFFLKSYLPIKATIENEQISLKPTKGTWIYIENYKTLEIEKDITIVGIENSETFTFIENYEYLFKNVKPLFLLRYNNNSYIEWLQQIPNDYLHFGDFDLSGIATYITDFKNKFTNKKCGFFIPENIQELIINSKNKRDYIKQLNDKRVVSVEFQNHKEVMGLVQLIKDNKRTVEQEKLMNINFKSNWRQSIKL
jgi:hypothetical protein